MLDKVRVYEIAEEAGATSSEVIDKAKDLGIELKSPQTAVSYEEAEEITTYIMTGKSKLLKEKTQPKKKVQKVIKDELIEKKEENINPSKEVSQDSEKTKVEVEKANDIVKSNNDDETAQVSQEIIMPKRRGLKIVKKKEPIQTVSVEASKKQTKSLSELLDSNMEAKLDKKPQQQFTKIKKEKKKIPPKAHEHGHRLDVDRANDEFKSSDDLLEADEVVLLDLDQTEINTKFFEEQKPLNIRTSKPSSFVNQPQTLRRGKRKKRPRIDTKTSEEVTSVDISENIRVYEFAEKVGKSVGEVIGKLFGLGMMVTKNDFLDSDAIEILADEFGVEVNVKDDFEDLNYVEETEETIDDKDLVTRPPVVTIMGHVDHGKTTLLDTIRSTNVARGEAGGITQHIAAYTVVKNGQEITFVDTPGHSAFSAMRARGASVTDIVIIVVAADDGVKPQTREAITHAKASGGPIIVAINKVDKPAANIDMVKTQMAEVGLMPVEWGGDTEFVEVSALKGIGIDNLLDTILIQAEMLELKGNPKAKAKAVVVEASLEVGRGAVSTVIVQNGTLRVGDPIVADTTYGKIKAIHNDKGQKVKELKLSQTGQILGLNEVPFAGAVVAVQDSEKEAKEIATKRAELSRAKELSKSTKVSLEELSGMIAEGKIKSLPVIVKADVAGSLEAIKSALEEIRNDEVKVNVIHSGIGGISENDLTLASASSNCIILGFNIRPTGQVKNKAKSLGIDIKTYTVIYDLLDDVRATLSGMMSAIVREENTGQAQVRETFVVPKVGTVAGCIVSDGKVIRGEMARIIRDGVIVYTGKISSLKRFKDDVKEVGNGYECGIMFEKFNDIKVNDYIETFIQIKEQASI
ncbi:translation initiation factor IF-2 [Arcobacter sp. FWKO B]|uniref:translation initiation factor IF-2 n=1 Tax=Arcobacter sp. FWKO B TaxID=2593672 RepID=UPI0018A4699E|nr:translation initiation factor IF-2 [Arcobacter sp. FWKO B]QOG12630.1 translation initiation factor IF-2 [Arcobacter sp. FWKO B]